VYCRVTVPFTQALLGGQIEVPSMYGAKPLFVEIDPGTQHEQLYKVQDEGFYSISKQKKGDLYIQICLAVPKTVNDNEKKLLQKLAKLPTFKSLYKAL
jgi:molecular chaperone DnaJ